VRGGGGEGRGLGLEEVLGRRGLGGFICRLGGSETSIWVRV
jgi:hypothetical protein